VFNLLIVYTFLSHDSIQTLSSSFIITESSTKTAADTFERSAGGWKGTLN